jgi:transcriptional regulator with XRE-family HTH domain
MQEESLGTQLKAIMEVNHLSQKDVASAVEISQATVSRVLRIPRVRKSKATAKLFSYMQQYSTTGKNSEGQTIVLQAFESIWDRSEAHATAIATIIKATAGLAPQERQGD